MSTAMPDVRAVQLWDCNGGGNQVWSLPGA
jgi:hypothetical protein